MRKIPKSKHQIPNKFQYSNSKSQIKINFVSVIEYWDLELIPKKTRDRFVIWDLIFGIFEGYPTI